MMDEKTRQVWRRLYARRILLGEKQYVLAAMLGISPNVLSDLEHGRGSKCSITKEPYIRRQYAKLLRELEQKRREPVPELLEEELADDE